MKACMCVSLVHKGKMRDEKQRKEEESIGWRDGDTARAHKKQEDKTTTRTSSISLLVRWSMKQRTKWSRRVFRIGFSIIFSHHCCFLMVLFRRVSLFFFFLRLWWVSLSFTPSLFPLFLSPPTQTGCAQTAVQRTDGDRRLRVVSVQLFLPPFTLFSYNLCVLFFIDGGKGEQREGGRASVWCEMMCHGDMCMDGAPINKQIHTHAHTNSFTKQANPQPFLSIWPQQ